LEAVWETISEMAAAKRSVSDDRPVGFVAKLDKIVSAPHDYPRIKFLISAANKFAVWGAHDAFVQILDGLEAADSSQSTAPSHC